MLDKSGGKSVSVQFSCGVSNSVINVSLSSGRPVDETSLSAVVGEGGGDTEVDKGDSSVLCVICLLTSGTETCSV